MSSPLTHPLLRAGLADPRLRNHHAFHVLVQLVEILPPDEPREIYQASLALTLHMNRETVRRAMAALVKRHYLLVFPANPRGVRSYALNTPVRLNMATVPPRTDAAPLPGIARSA